MKSHFFLVVSIIVVITACNTSLGKSNRESWDTNDIFQEDFFIKKFEGAIGGNSVVMILMRRNRELYGNYYVADSSKLIAFQGDIVSEDSLVLCTEFGEERFKGKIIDDSIVGIWCDKNNKKLAFNLSKKKTDEIKYFFTSWHQNYDAFEIESNSSSKIDINMINVKTSSVDVSRNINEKIEEMILEEVQFYDEDYKTIQEFLMSDISKEEIIKIDCNLVSDDNNILCIEIYTFYYGFGAAAHLSTRYYYNFDLETGCLITLEDLFPIIDKTNFYKIAEEKYRDNFNWYVDYDEFELSKNFAITQTGLIFVYDSKWSYNSKYGVNLIINNDEVKQIMKTDSLLIN